MKLASRAFGVWDQEVFAALSGDRNPLHLDAIRARRTQAGAPVVHGVHLLLWTLDALAAANPDLQPLRKLRVKFNTFLYLGESADAVVIERHSDDVRLVVRARNSAITDIAIDFGVTEQELHNTLDEILESVPPPDAPLDLSLEQIPGCSGCLAYATQCQATAAAFPAAARWLGEGRVGALGAATNLIGMVSPGLHSLFSGMTLESCAAPEGRAALCYKVTHVDPRFRRVRHQVWGGGLCGNLESFVRAPPTAQASMETLNGRVQNGEFAGSTALIVGGSRGIGEVTAKLIATGGGRVIITYHVGKDDAERVATEIRSAGAACEVHPYNALESAVRQLSSLEETPTHAYYFATPPILRTSSGLYGNARFDTFSRVYVEGFWTLANELRVRSPGLSIFYPSSIFIDDRPKGMTEYAMAKAAGELLCEDMNRYMRPLRVIVRRLPRLATDQTAAIGSVETAPMIETMLPIIREVQTRGDASATA